MTKLVTAHYSKKTGLRVSNAFAERNPNYVNVLTIDPNFLRGSVVKIARDGMPVNWTIAEAVKLAWNTHQAKLAARRAQYKAKKMKKAAAVVKAYGKKAATVKKGTKKVNKPAVALPAVPPPLI